MRLSIKSISLVIAALTPIFIGVSCSAKISDADLREFGQNDIEFYDPSCDEGSSSGGCGNTAREIYWSIFKDLFGAIPAAGILGNVGNEGGYNPVGVESCDHLNPYNIPAKDWIPPWNEWEYLNGDMLTGVGALGITWGRKNYFQYIRDNGGNDLIEKYFVKPAEYSFGVCQQALPFDREKYETPGDALKDKIGDTDFRRLVKLEIEYVQVMISQDNTFNMDTFKASKTPSEAALYWSMNYERCSGCDAAGSATNISRTAEAEKVYEEMKDFVCTTDSSSSGGTYPGKKYNLSDADLDTLIQLAIREEGSAGVPGVNTSLSQMANRADLPINNYGDVLDYVIDSGWYGSAISFCTKGTRRCSLNAPISDEQRQAAKDIIVNGNRTIPPQIVEHDCAGDIEWLIDEQGKQHYSSGHTEKGCDATGLEDKSLYVRGKTRIHNYTKGEYIFYDWANPQEKTGDPFGYEENNPPSDAGSARSNTSSSSSGLSASANTKNAPAKFTLIGDSISVQSEKELEAAFKDSVFNMVGNRGADVVGRCSGDDTALTVLKKLSQGSGTIMKQHWNTETCETITVDRSMMLDSVVWEIGANLGQREPEDFLNEVMEYVGTKRKLYLVTPYNGSETTTYGGQKTLKEVTNEVAQAYRDFAAKHDNVYIIDWNKAVSADEDKYITHSDGMSVHPTEEGRRLLVELISGASSSTDTCTSATIDLNNFEWYIQTEEPWKNVLMAGVPGATIGNGGCGPTSFAMMASIQLGKTITPKDAAEALTRNDLDDAGGGILGANFTSATKTLADKFGLEFEEIPWTDHQAMEKTINKYLDEGWFVQIAGKNGRLFPTMNHWVGIIQRNDQGKWRVVDSVATEARRDEWFDPQTDVLGYAIGAVPKAIRATGSSGNSTGGSGCSEVCGSSKPDDANGGQIVSGGMNKSQAEKFMDNYRNMSDDEYKSLMASGIIESHPDCCPHCTNSKVNLANCTMFSRWFLATQTTVELKGPTGNGGAVVDNLENTYHLPTGNIPQPYAIFSGEGHTGVVLGIDKEKDIMIIGEANCTYRSDAYETIGTREVPLSEWSSGTYKYAYTDKVLKMSK